MDSAGHYNNECLLAYYFALSIVCLLAGALRLMADTKSNLLVLYIRDFSSTAVRSIQQSYIEPPA